MLEPYYQDATATLYCGDCVYVASQLDVAQFDVAICDPPYGDTKLDWDIRNLSWLAVCDRLVKPNGTIWCFGSMKMFMTQAPDIERMGWRHFQEIIWEKHNGSSFISDRFRRVHEICVQLVRRDCAWSDIYKSPVTTPDAQKRYVRRKKRPPHMGDQGDVHYESEDGGPRLMRSVIPVRSCHGRAVHPTQKPLGILTPLIEYSCPPDGVVFDPTCGAGSTLVAAKNLGRRSVGIELDPEYCDHAARRLAESLPFMAAPAP